MGHIYLGCSFVLTDVRLIQILIPDGKRQAVLEVLEEKGVGYSVAEETEHEEYDVVVQFPLPTSAVESVLDELQSVGIDESTYTIVLDVEAVISEEFDELLEEYSDKTDDEEDDVEHRGITGEERIAREEILTRANDMVTATPTYVVLTLLSAVIATAGMLLDSPATVVGSMVIAPLIGPTLAASVGTVLNDRTLFHRGVKLQILGIVVAISSAAVFALLVRYLFLVPPGLDILEFSEINERASPNFLVLAIALGAGVAGMLSLITGVSTALVGVMIAVALIPPAAGVGLGIAFGVPRLAIGAGILVTVNVLSINLSSLVALWFEGYRPEHWFQIGEARGAFVKQAAALALTITLISVFLGGATYDSYVATNVEEEIRQEVGDELELADAQLELRDITVTRSGIVPPLETDRVVVRIAIDPDDDPPRLGDRLKQRIEAVTGTLVDIEVEYVMVERAESVTTTEARQSVRPPATRAGHTDPATQIE